MRIGHASQQVTTKEDLIILILLLNCWNSTRLVIALYELIVALQVNPIHGVIGKPYIIHAYESK